jgi:hypothetical protein
MPKNTANHYTKRILVCSQRDGGDLRSAMGCLCGDDVWLHGKVSKLPLK